MRFLGQIDLFVLRNEQRNTLFGLDTHENRRAISQLNEQLVTKEYWLLTTDQINRTDYNRSNILSSICFTRDATAAFRYVSYKIYKRQ